MKKEQLPRDGEEVLFISPSTNQNRRSLNLSMCTIRSRKELNPDSYAYADYTDNIAVEIQFSYYFDDNKHNGAYTWADLNEIHLIPA